MLVGPSVDSTPPATPWTRQSGPRGWSTPIPSVWAAGVWIGGGVRVMPGVSIGDGAVIASGSVVTKDIPAGVLAAGVPCRPIRPITAADRMLP